MFMFFFVVRFYKVNVFEIDFVFDFDFFSFISKNVFDNVFCCIFVVDVVYSYKM